MHREGRVRRQEQEGSCAREIRRREALQEGVVQGRQVRQGDRHRRGLADATGTQALQTGLQLQGGAWTLQGQA